MKTVILSLLLFGSAATTSGAVVTILSLARTLNAYSSGYQYQDPSWNEFEHPPGTPWPLITILPDDRTDSSIPGIGASSLTVASAANYVGTGTAVATANIEPDYMTVFLSSRAGDATGGSPPGPDLNPGAWNSSARASFEVKFMLDGLTLLQFSGNAAGFNTFGIWPGYLLLRDAANATLYSLTFPAGDGGGTINHGMILPAGTYSFQTSTHVDPVNPQAGYNPLSRLTANLQLTPLVVPEPGTFMFAMMALGFSVIRRRRVLTRA